MKVGFWVRFWAGKDVLRVARMLASAAADEVDVGVDDMTRQSRSEDTERCRKESEGSDQGGEADLRVAMMILVESDGAAVEAEDMTRQIKSVQG
jgi:hypothetical protein